MNTSSRRAPVIAWAITAGVLYGGVGVVIPAPAGADDTAAGPGAGTQTDASGAASASNASEPRRHGRGTASAADDGSTEPDDHPCPWWPRPLPKPMPFVPGRGGGNGGGFIAPVVAPTAPVAVFGDRVIPAGGTGTLPDGLPDLTGLPAPAPVARAPVAAAPASSAVLPAATAPPARPIPRTIPTPPITPAAIPGPRVAVAVPAAPAPPAPERLGYPEVLRDADVVTLLSRALPGLAAMFGMTALGGVLGYRQARAGYLLRAAGTGRFLR